MKSNPYELTSDDVIFEVFYQIIEERDDKNEMRISFFSKGQPCLRSSPLAKKYGWGIHSNEHEKVAIYAVHSPEYVRLKDDKNIVHSKGMRSKK